MAADEYQALVQKVEGFVAAVAARRASELACKRGCDGCCHTWLTVSAVEAEQVRAALAALSDAHRAVLRARGQRELAREQHAASGTPADPDPPRCALLEDDGSCASYAARPLVCRTQGHALRYPADFVPEAAVRMRTKGGVVTWCPLNYTGAPPRSEDVLDAERVDQILALVGHRHAGSAAAAAERTSLSELAARA
jgi:Fe-S-cluster containining protein